MVCCRVSLEIFLIAGNSMQCKGTSLKYILRLDLSTCGPVVLTSCGFCAEKVSLLEYI